MTRRVLRVAAILGLTNVAWFGFLVLAGRSLPKPVFGVLSLCFSAALVMLAVADFGLTSTVARWFSSRDLGDWNWLQAFRRTAPLAVVSVAVGAVLLATVYGVDPLAAAGTGLAALGLVVLRSVGAGLLRAHARPGTGVLTEKGFRLALPVAGAALLAAGLLTARAWVLAWAGLIVAAAAIAGLTAWRRLPRGRTPLEPVYWSGALLFWGMSALYLAATYWDRLLVPRLLGLERMAAYSAVVSLLMGFDVLTTALAYVLLPRFGRAGDVSMLRECLLPLALAGLGAVAYLFLGPPVLHLFFAGKYDGVADSIPALAVVGIIRVLYVVPSSVIATRFLRPQLTKLLVYDVALLVVHLALLFVLLPRMGLIGAVLVNGLVALLRHLGSWILALRRLAELRAEPEPAPAAPSA